MNNSTEIESVGASGIALDTGVDSECDVQSMLAANMASKWWRLNNLYWIIDKQGQRCKFRCNRAQTWLYNRHWFLNIVLKARQLGFTTFICLWILDEALFHRDIEAGVIAHTKDDATKIFRRKFKYPYDNLPDWIRAARPLVIESKTELSFNNGSIISVGTSMRSGTLNFLLVTELAKIAAKYPDKAREIKTGSLETIATGQMAWIESTAEGSAGMFYEYCQTAEKQALGGTPLTPLDYRFFFFPWYMNPEYQLDPDSVVIPDTLKAYFEKISAENSVKISPAQRAWFTKKKERLGDDMKREYPSNSKESFEESIEGAYFKTQFRAIYKEGRICSVPVQDGVLVHTWWDIGMDDATAIWFVQLVGREVHCVDYLEHSGEGVAYYKRKMDERGYLYGQHLAPHDIKVREWGAGQGRLKSAEDAGLFLEMVPKCQNKMDSIESARTMLSICWFDEEKCAEGIKHLENYRKEWDEKRQCYRTVPLHDEHSNGADAFQTGAWGRSLILGGSKAKAVDLDAQGGSFGGLV